MSDYLDLYDYRRRVTMLYQKRNQAIQNGEEPSRVLEQFRKGRDALFATHPQSAFDEQQKLHFESLHYFPYNPALCIKSELETDVEHTQQQITMNANKSMMMTTVGQIHFVVEATPVVLSVYWLDIYAGGLFLPFRDTTSPQQSYGGGRYLFDTMKGSDFLPASNIQYAGDWKHMILDFNYAYNPSCAYNDRWFCPLAPQENRLTVPIRAGEMKYKE